MYELSWCKEVTMKKLIRFQKNNITKEVNRVISTYNTTDNTTNMVDSISNDKDEKVTKEATTSKKEKIE